MFYNFQQVSLFFFQEEFLSPEFLRLVALAKCEETSKETLVKLMTSEKGEYVCKYVILWRENSLGIYIYQVAADTVELIFFHIHFYWSDEMAFWKQGPIIWRIISSIFNSADLPGLISVDS